MSATKKGPYFDHPFARQLRIALAVQWIRQCKLAKEIGCSPSSINHYANGSRIPDGLTIANVARALHVSADILLDLRRLKKWNTAK